MDHKFASFDFSEDSCISAQLSRNIKASKGNDSLNSKSGKWSKEEVFFSYIGRSIGGVSYYIRSKKLEKDI